MEQFLIIGVNHSTAPVNIRERLSFDSSKTFEIFNDLNKLQIKKGVILSTCNRIEIYLHSNINKIEIIIDWLSKYHKIKLIDLKKYIYYFQNEKAIEHLMEVAVGLDSMIIGEPQILGQLKESYNISHNLNLLNSYLEKIFQNTFSVAKLIRSNTDIGKNSLSIAQISIQLAQKHLKNLKDKNALIIGIGQTSKLVLKYLLTHTKNITIANRTLSKAQHLHKNTIELKEIHHILDKVDLIISATSSDIPILGIEHFKKNNRKILLIDLAVPRDIDSNISKLNNKTLFSIDDLKQVLDCNKQKRQEAVLQAKNMIQNKTQELISELKMQETKELIKSISQKALNFQKDLINQNLSQEVLTSKLINKLIHSQIIAIKKLSKEKSNQEIKELFQI